jgi:hypothetical protein
VTTPTTDVINYPSIQADAIRICREGADGTPVADSTTGAYANYAFTKVDVKAAIETANEFVQRSADGGIFIDYRDDDKVKWLELTLTIQYPDACLQELIENGALLLGAESIILGYEAPLLASNVNSNPVSLEVWSKAPVGVLQGTTYPWYRWLFPMTRGWHRGDLTYENAVNEFVYDGWGFENANFGTGPFDDWTTTETSEGDALDSTRCFEWIASTALPETLGPGYLATPS